MENIRDLKSPRMKRLHTKGYVMNAAAKNAMYEQNGLWFVPMNIHFADKVGDESRAAIEDMLSVLRSKKDIALELGTNVYQLNRSLKRWFGTSNYKKVLIKLREMETDENIKEFTK